MVLWTFLKVFFLITSVLIFPKLASDMHSVIIKKMETKLKIRKSILKTKLN